MWDVENSYCKLHQHLCLGLKETCTAEPWETLCRLMIWVQTRVSNSGPQKGFCLKARANLIVSLSASNLLHLTKVFPPWITDNSESDDCHDEPPPLTHLFNSILIYILSPASSFCSRLWWEQANTATGRAWRREAASHDCRVKSCRVVYWGVSGGRERGPPDLELPSAHWWMPFQQGQLSQLTNWVNFGLSSKGGSQINNIKSWRIEYS